MSGCATHNGIVNMGRYPIFIVGSPRSGTSALVDVLLAAGYSGFREGMFLSLLYGLDSVVSTHFLNFAGDATDEVLISKIVPGSLKEDLFAIVKKHVESTNSTGPWFDKTGNAEMIMSIPIIRQLWPSSVFIFAKRRGLENVLSRMRKFPGYDFEYHCRDWAANMSAWREIRMLLSTDSFIEVDQQDMIQRPEAVAASLCHFLHLDSSELIESTLRLTRPQQSESQSAERIVSLDDVNWSHEQLIVFGRYCAAEMEAYGYSIDNRYRADSGESFHV